MKKLCSFVVVDSFLGSKAFEVNFFFFFYVFYVIQDVRSFSWGEGGLLEKFS